MRATLLLLTLSCVIPANAGPRPQISKPVIFVQGSYCEQRCYYEHPRDSRALEACLRRCGDH